MGQVLWTSQNGKWEIILEKNDRFPEGFIVVTDGWFCDYPIMYDNGKVAYDYPERIPVYVRDKVEKIMARVFGC